MAVLDYDGLKRYDKKAKGLIAETYDPTSTYAVGDLCIYPENGSLYRCTTAITTAGAWNNSYWELATVDEELSGLKGSLNSKVIQVTIPCSSAGTFNYTVSGLTANHRLLRYQFLSGGTTETGDILADITTTTGANSLNVVISTVYTSGSVILLFGIPTVATATST